jgi:hypothetical protein
VSWSWSAGAPATAIEKKAAANCCTPERTTSVAARSSPARCKVTFITSARPGTSYFGDVSKGASESQGVFRNLLVANRLFGSDR